MAIPYDTRSIFLGRSTTPPPALALHRAWRRRIRRTAEKRAA